MRMTHELQMCAMGTIFIIESLNFHMLFPIPYQFLNTIKKNDENLITAGIVPLRE